MLAFRKTLRTLLHLIIAGWDYLGSRVFPQIFIFFSILRSFLLCVYIMFLEVLPEIIA